MPRVSGVFLMEASPVPRPKSQNGPCLIEGCDRPKKSKGMCAKHYLSAYLEAHPGKNVAGVKRGHPLYVIWFERKQRGSLCQEWASDFWAFVAGVGERPSKTHLLRPLRFGEPYSPENFEWLGALKREPGESRKAFHARKWQSRRERFPEYEGHRSMKRKYGVTPEQFQEMHREQNGLCFICHEPETRISPKTHAPQALAIDHCHTTNRVRKLLCSRCNTTIGKVNESPELLEAMLTYLRLHDDPGDVL